MTNLHHLTTHSTTCWPTKWRSHCDHRYVTSLHPMYLTPVPLFRCRQPIAAAAQSLTVKFLKNTHLRPQRANGRAAASTRVLEYSSTTRVLNYSSNFLLLEYSLWSPYVIGQTYIFLPCDFYLSILFYSSPNLSRHRLDVYHTSTQGMWP